MAQPFVCKKSASKMVYRIFIRLREKRLYVCKNNRLYKKYVVAVGKLSTPTPKGNFTVINRQENPGGHYGEMWIGLSVPHIGIHGTNEPWLIGKAISHGCVRMYNNEASELAYMIPNGTPVQITD
ncbi:MAG: L,D-transpeptidase [Eubacteriales bacterium]